MTKKPKVDDSGYRPRMEFRALVDFMEGVHERIEALGLTQTVLAERMGRSQSQVSRLFTGLTPLTSETMARIAHALDCDVRVMLVPRGK